jgi:UDP-N-acetylmuramate-alanine ligase
MEIDMTKYSATQISRIKQALIETHNAMAREMAYRPDLRNIEMIDFYAHHIAKLEAMLAD